MGDRWEKDIKLTFLRNVYIMSFPSYIKMVLLTHFLADFTKEKGGLASGFSQSVDLVTPMLTPEEGWSGLGSHSMVNYGAWN